MYINSVLYNMNIFILFFCILHAIVVRDIYSSFVVLYSFS